MGNFVWSDASSSVKEAQRVSATSSAPRLNCCEVPKGSRRKHWDSRSIQDWLKTAELVGPRVYSCSHCRNHVCLHDDIISKEFQGRNGRAFLSSHAMNITTGAKEDRQFMTGLHTVADIHCRDCREVLGWKYERAYEESQKYKEGKFIFEKDKIVQKNREMAELVGPRVYSCRHCRNHVCLHDDIISKAFQGRNGRAFLSYHAMNVTTGAKEDRQLMTGLHTVADIHCHDCREVLGWKYERAYEESHKYKEGRFIFEKAKIMKENW
ncbi:hypothetical protein ACQJBY_072490 [Aegilops geniculata]